MSKSKSKPISHTTKIAVASGVVVLVVGTGIWLSRSAQAAPTPKARRPKANLQQVVQDAAQSTGETEPNPVTDEAYFTLYPNCPQVLNPDDPSHADCIAKWLELYAYALDLLGTPTADPSNKAELAEDVVAELADLDDAELDLLDDLIGGEVLAKVLGAPGQGLAEINRVVRSLRSKLRKLTPGESLELKEALGDGWESLEWFTSVQGEDGRWHPPKVIEGTIRL